MLNLHGGTFWHLHPGCFEIRHFCFGLDYLILLCNGIPLQLAVYFGKVEGLFRGEYFSYYHCQKLQETFSLIVQFELGVNRIFRRIGDLHLLAIRLFFPSVMSLLYGDVSLMFLKCLSDIHTRCGAVVQWLSLLHNFIQLSLSSGPVQVQTLLADCHRFAMVRISDSSPGWK